jgi:hypothetical protein
MKQQTMIMRKRDSNDHVLYQQYCIRAVLLDQSEIDESYRWPQMWRDCVLNMYVSRYLCATIVCTLFDTSEILVWCLLILRMSTPRHYCCSLCLEYWVNGWRATSSLQNPIRKILGISSSFMRTPILIRHEAFPCCAHALVRRSHNISKLFLC